MKTRITGRLASWDGVERLTPQVPAEVRYPRRAAQGRDWGAMAFCGLIAAVPALMWALGWLMRGLA